MTELIKSPIEFTDNAIAELHAIRDRDEIPAGQVLRIGVKGGGCSGLSYILEFGEKEELDEQYDIAGLPVVLDPRHGLYIQGMKVDYQPGLNSRGFEFINPNAKESCGCGESFST